MSGEKWVRVGNGYRCGVWDIGCYFLDGATLWVLWNKEQCKPVGHFEDVASAMKRAKELAG